MADTVTLLEGYGVKIKDVNHNIGIPLREVDIELENGIIIQVKNLGGAKKMTRQLEDTQKATGRTVIGYIVETHENSTDIINNIDKGNQVATNSIDDLIDLVK
ncbi:MAG: hypothetical protein R3B84_24885 [Zavarzinella sp.]